MHPAHEPLPLHIRLLHDVASIAIVALVLVPGYLLLNQYWRSLVLLGALYMVLGLVFLRLGWYVRRVMRRLPAEIPPWQTLPRSALAPPYPLMLYGHGEAIDSVQKDPMYLQDIVKPRLRQMLAYRLSGSPDTPFESLDGSQLAQVDPDLLDFLNRPETTSLWATYRYRTQRLHNLLAALQRVEAV
ncbi:MAG: hypothetical protein OEU26_25400 [Candidatus Tectomicrobia bacterium]|nr:hypothetical protein [Candidatus Tectomicrobia bacterium]